VAQVARQTVLLLVGDQHLASTGEDAPLKGLDYVLDRAKPEGDDLVKGMHQMIGGYAPRPHAVATVRDDPVEALGATKLIYEAVLPPEGAEDVGHGQAHLHVKARRRVPQRLGDVRQVYEIAPVGQLAPQELQRLIGGKDRDLVAGLQ
jgi:hypothetical protein